jgi:hypothetical protein
VAIVSYDEKPGIQAIATTAPDLPPKPGVHATFARDYEYKREGKVITEFPFIVVAVLRRYLACSEN